MNKTSQILMALAFLVGTASTGLAMDKQMKDDVGEANTPEKIQRSTPSGQEALKGGSGPGSRSDQLTEMEEVEPQDPTLAKKKGAAAEAAHDLKEKGMKDGISAQGSSGKSHE